MDKVKVAELAEEFSLKPALVVAELKKLGVFVTVQSAVDGSIVERVRKRLQILVEPPAPAEKKPEKPHLKEKTKTVVKSARRVEAKPAPAEAEKPAAPIEVETKKPVATAQRKGPSKGAAEKAPAKSEAPAKAVKPAARRVASVEARAAIQEKPVPAVTAGKPRRIPKAKVEVPESHEPQEVVVGGAPVELEAPGHEAAAVVAQEPALEKPVEKAAGVQVAEPAEKPEAVEKAEAADRVEKAEKPERHEKKTIAERVAVPRPVSHRIQPRILKKTGADALPAQPDVSAKIFRSLPEIQPPSRRPLAPRRLDKMRKGRPEEAARPAARPHEVARRPLSPEEYRPVQLTEGLTVGELSEKLGIKSKEIIKSLFSKGVAATINRRLEANIIQQICSDYGFRPELHTFEEELTALENAGDRQEDYGARAPVVTIMGHVDHGKTSLLDAIRETRVTEQEAGGITQHIGAYSVSINNRRIVFLDTPGHEAFTMMRARGAQVTDIVVLVVAADDGVMPQTLEAIHHARAAGVPIIVAINKIDKAEAQPDRIRQTLSEHGLAPEDWGGDTVMVNVSAKKRVNLELLLEMILLVADMKELKANPRRPASGVVLEAKLDRGRGPVATVLVQNGTLRVGDTFIAGAVYGRVRAMFDSRGELLKVAPPSTPAEVLGLQALPQAGDTLHVIEDTDKAKQIGSYRQAQLREKALQKTSRLSLEHLHELLRPGEQKELPLILKADVQGSVEVLTDTLSKLSNERVKIRFIHSAAGAITESDVLLASASNAIVIGFNVRPDKTAQEVAEREGVDIRLHTVIYNVSNEIKSAMSGLLETTTREKRTGSATVRNVFKIPKAGTIAGCQVSDGVIARNAQVRLLRDNVVIYEGRIDSLKRFKEDAAEVRSGFECGIRVERFSDIKVDDVIEAFVIEKVMPEPMFETASRKS